MPTYTSTLDTSAYAKGPAGYVLLTVGENILNFYLKALPTGITLTDHDPVISPWELLGDIVAYPSSDINVFDRDKFTIYNATAGVVTVSANGDDANAISLLAGTKNEFSNTSGKFGILTILTGTGHTYVWGF